MLGGLPRVTTHLRPSFSTYLVPSASSSSSSSSSTSSPYLALYKDFTSASWSSSFDMLGGLPRVTTHLRPSFSTQVVSCSSSSSSASSSSTSSPYFALYKDFTSASWSSSCDMLGGLPRVTTHLSPSFSTYLVSCSSS